MLDGAAAGVDGDFNNTPTVAGGCLYLASDTGWVLAANADTGEVLWTTKLEHSIASSLAVHDGRVFVSVNRADQPYLVALDQATGAELWRTTLDKQPGSDLFSSPVPFNGMVMVGVSGAGAESGTTATGNPQTRLHFRGAYLLLDQATGEIIVKDHPIPDEDFYDYGGDYSGGGVWSTAAIDTATNYAYVGGGNPFTAAEHPNTNAILKIDVDPSRPTFGRIVGSYHGSLDQYLDALSSKPVCEAYVDVFTCELMDYDFGASPQLFTDAEGGSSSATSRSPASTTPPTGTRWKGRGRRSSAVPSAWSATSPPPPSTGPRCSPPGRCRARWPRSPRPPAPRSGPRRSPTASTTSRSRAPTGSRTPSTARACCSPSIRRRASRCSTRPLFQDTGQPPGSGLQGGGVTIARHTVYVPAPGGFLVAYR